ncbi:uncharacterized protein [Haliotis cracherodii]|uniref:uncharacterized protein isoform X2 n=1 Tax=Haliotis cracherodii TaxID=6455 RepID=UPI0039EC98E8
MPGKRSRKARAKRAGKRNSSSEESRRKSSASADGELTESLGATGGTPTDGESSESVSPDKCEDEFDFSSGLATGADDQTAKEMGNEQGKSLLLCQVDLDVKAGSSSVGEQAQLSVKAVPCGYSDDVTKVQHRDSNGNNSLTSCKYQDDGDTTSTNSTQICKAPPPVGQQGRSQCVPLSSPLDNNEETTHSEQSSSFDRSCEERHTIEDELGTSVDPVSFQPCVIQKELYTQIQAVELKTLPTEGKGHVCLEASPVMKFNDSVSESDRKVDSGLNTGSQSPVEESSEKCVQTYNYSKDESNFANIIPKDISLDSSRVGPPSVSESVGSSVDVVSNVNVVTAEGGGVTAASDNAVTAPAQGCATSEVESLVPCNVPAETTGAIKKHQASPVGEGVHSDAPVACEGEECVPVVVNTDDPGSDEDHPLCVGDGIHEAGDVPDDDAARGNSTERGSPTEDNCPPSGRDTCAEVITKSLFDNVCPSGQAIQQDDAECGYSSTGKDTSAGLTDQSSSDTKGPSNEAIQQDDTTPDTKDPKKALHIETSHDVVDTDACLSAGIHDTDSDLNDEQLDIVTTYIDFLFEPCFSPSLTGSETGDPDEPEGRSKGERGDLDTSDTSTCGDSTASGGVQEEGQAASIAFYLDNVFEKTTEASSKSVTEALEDMHECASDLDPNLDLNLDPNLDPILVDQQTTELLSVPAKNVINPFDIQNFQQMSPRLETIKETRYEKESNSKEQTELEVESQDSTSSRNLPDVVSSSTSVCVADPVYVAADDACHVGSRGLPVAADVQWRASLIYISRVCTMYKLLEALYNAMCVTLRTGRRRKGQDPTSRVILQCEGSRLTGAAIQSLDSLNDQIVQYIFAQNNVDLDLEKDLSPRERETLKSSMVLIRGLLIDAQSKFRKMVDDNRQLAVKIDGSIQAANQEVNVLRAELADTNKRLSQITLTNDLKVEKATQSESDNCLRHKSDEENELTKMKEENLRLEAAVKSLTREVQELKLAKAVSSEQPSYGELKLELIQTRQEVNRAKEALQAMKADRKRLKGEKLDLLNQMKQLYTTLEDKESELRDFIRNYEQRVHESDQTIKQLAMEKEDCEREKWRIIKKAQEAAERAVNLRSQCDNKDQALKKLEVELAELKTHPVDHNKSSSASEADHTTHSVASTIASEELPPYETMSQSDVSRDDSFSVKTSTPSHDSNVNSFTNPNKLLNTSHELPEHDTKKRHRIPVFGSLTRMFSKGRLRRSIALPHGETFDDPGHPKLALLSPDNYQEKLALVNGLKGVHMTNWKANQVLAWLEISLSMPMYGKMCAENIKSGKVLLGLSDSDLGAALGITNSIHRRKLRLAIEEQRDPGEIKYSKAANIDHTWVSHRWIPDLGLPQHAAMFESQLADGRLLNQLSKKDLEKHFSVHRKFHQASILHAVELLRLLNFDKELLTERRSQCEDNNTDPLVWSNDKVMKWIRSIELGEYVQNLRESGVHGALMVLEPSFTADTLATALGIPLSKSYLRRHIATELEALIKPARAALDTPNNNTKMRINGTGSVGRSFIRSYRSASLDDGGPKGRLSFRGSLGRAFGRKIKDDLRMTFDSDVTPKSRRGIKISDPIPIQHNHSLDSIVEPDSTTV